MAATRLGGDPGAKGPRACVRRSRGRRGQRRHSPSGSSSGDFGLARLRERDRPRPVGGRHAGVHGARAAPRGPRRRALGHLPGRRSCSCTCSPAGGARARRVLAPPLEGLAGLGTPRCAPSSSARSIPIPRKRFQTARALGAALAGRSTPAPPTIPRAARPVPAPRAVHRGRPRPVPRPRGPSPRRSPSTPLFRRSVIYTAPSGTGKTSMLRAGLRAAPRGARHPGDLPGVPRPAAPRARGGDRAQRRRVRPAAPRRAGGRGPASGPASGPALDAATDAAGSDVIDAAIELPRKQHDRRLVLVLDRGRVRARRSRAPARGARVQRWPADADVAIVLSVREIRVLNTGLAKVLMTLSSSRRRCGNSRRWSARRWSAHLRRSGLGPSAD